MPRIDISKLEQRDIHDIAMLAKDKKFSSFERLLNQVKDDVINKLGKGNDSPELYRNQGIYQFLEELSDLFLKGLDW